MADRIPLGSPVEVKPEAGLGGWRRGTLRAYHDDTRKVEVVIGRRTVVVPTSRMREVDHQQLRREQDLKRTLPNDGDAWNTHPGAKPPARAPKAERIEKARAIVSIPKATPARSDAYLDFIRARPCHHCGAPAPSEAAHFAPKGDGGGTSTKADDRRTVPECHRCHDHFHQHGVLPKYLSGPAPRMQTENDIMREQVRCLIAWLDRGEAM